MNLERLFYPKCLAIIGASGQEGKLGYNVLRNLIDHGYEGKIYPVNPKHEKIEGLRSYSSVSEIEEDVDAAVSIVPAKVTPKVVEECFQKGIKFVSVQSAGFGEKGGEGREIEKRLEELVDKYDSHILGPNCTGVINTRNGMCQSIGRVGELKTGNVGLVAQAGVYAAGILWGLKEIMSFSLIATIGNKLDIDETDLLKYLKYEDSVEVITLYLEDIARGGKFLDTAREIIEEKPIIVLKGGRTEEGKQTATTHTGSIGGAKEVYDTIFQEGGIIRAEDNDHMFDLARGFSKQPLPSTKNMMVITYSGSQGITATDTINEQGLQLARLEGETKRKIKETIPDVIEGSNPADLTFDQTPKQVREIIETAREDEEVGGFIVNLQPEILGQYVDEFSDLNNGGKPVLISVTGREFTMDTVKDMENIGFPVFSTPERAAKVAAKTWSFNRREIGDTLPKRFPVNEKKVEAIINKSLQEDRPVLGGSSALEIFDAYGIPVVENYLAKDPGEAQKVFDRLNGPVSMKVESSEVVHKTDAGGVRLNVDEAVDVVFDEMQDQVIERTGISKSEIDGVSIQPMLDGGKETLIGSTYEELVNGHIVRFGFGGKYTEVFKDISARTVPLDSRDVEEMIEETNYIKEIMRGPRGEEPCNEVLVQDSLLRLSQLVKDFPQIKEVEANPLLVWPNKAAVVDARLRLEKNSFLNKVL